MKLHSEIIGLKEYIDKAFKFVSLIFDFSKDRLRRLVNSFVYGNHTKDKER